MNNIYMTKKQGRKKEGKKERRDEVTKKKNK
jgi:hypothetical protein